MQWQFDKISANIDLLLGGMSLLLDGNWPLKQKDTYNQLTLGRQQQSEAGSLRGVDGLLHARDSDGSRTLLFDIFQTRCDVAVQADESDHLHLIGDWRSLPTNEWKRLHENFECPTTQISR